MFRQLTTIATTTLVESVRQPIYLLLIFVGIIAMVLAPSLAMYTMEHGGSTGGGDNLMLIDMGLSNLALWSLLLSVFIASNAVAREIDQRTVLTVVSKPVPRAVFVIGKFLGVTGATVLAFFLMSLVFLMTVRHQVMSTASDKFDIPVLLFGAGGALFALLAAAGANFYFRRPFVSTFVATLTIGLTLSFVLILLVAPDWTLQHPWKEFEVNEHQKQKLVVGMAVVLQAVLVLSTLALACSTRLNVVPTLLVCMGVALLGVTSSALSQWVNGRLEIPVTAAPLQTFSVIAKSGEPFLMQLAFFASKIIYMIAPNFQFLFPADALVQGKMISGVHLLTLTAYSGLYVLALLTLAIAMFQRREVG